MIFTIGQLFRGILANKYFNYLFLIVLGLFGLYYLYQSGHRQGVEVTERKYETLIQQAQLQQRERETKLLQQIEDERLQAEQRVEVLSLTHKKQIEETQRETEAIIESYRDESRRLHIEIDTRRMSMSDREATCHTDKPTGVVKAPLSERSAQFLVRQAGKADKVVHDLNLCKQTLKEYHDTITRYNQLLESTNQEALNQTKK